TQIALNTQLGDPEAQHFLLKRYNMQFLGRATENDATEQISGSEFLAELSRRWKSSQAQQVQDDEPLSKASIRRWVERGEVEKALENLPKLITDPEDLDMVSLLSNWYINWKRESGKGAEDSRTLENRYNKVLNGILEQLNNLPE
ncbi:MAG: hypothetical protein IT269_06635, partial [Saprospiraceae bacterium]|nr:hypothetical protein [Saprospiraceae bacterium]